MCCPRLNGTRHTQELTTRARAESLELATGFRVRKARLCATAMTPRVAEHASYRRSIHHREPLLMARPVLCHNGTMFRLLWLDTEFVGEGRQVQGLIRCRLTGSIPEGFVNLRSISVFIFFCTSVCCKHSGLLRQGIPRASVIIWSWQVERGKHSVL